VLWSPNTQLHLPFQNTALDYSGNARNGTINGSGVFATKPSGSRCLYFDGVGDYVTTPSFSQSGTVIIFSAWVRCKLFTEHQAFFADNGYSTTVGWLFCTRPANFDALNWQYANGASVDVHADDFFKAPYDDTWLHMAIACDYAGANCYFYRNASLFASVAMAGTPDFPSTARVKYIGSGNAVPAYPLTEGHLQQVYFGTLATMPAAGQMLANVNRLMLGMNPIW